MGMGGEAMPQMLYHQKRDPVPIVQGAGWDPGSARMGAINLAPP